MKTAVFNARSYDRDYLTRTNAALGSAHELHFFEARLGPDTAQLAVGYPAICCFVNDCINSDVIDRLEEGGTKLIALRCAGYNNVDVAAAAEAGIQIARVPSYSPQSVAEHTVALMLSLNRKIHRAHARVREGNFMLDGLLGFDLGRRTVGIVGTGQIGMAVAHILRGFGCKLIAHDPAPNTEFVDVGGSYVELGKLLSSADIVTLHCPLTPDTHHLIDSVALDRMKEGAMLVNTSRGAVIESSALIAALKTKKIGHLALDVYEEEDGLFFSDVSNSGIQDDLFARLITFPNVLITAHQGFFTHEALEAIATTTLKNLTGFERDGSAPNRIN